MNTVVVVRGGGGGGCTVEEVGGGCTVEEVGGGRVVVDVVNVVAADDTLELTVRLVGGTRRFGSPRTGWGISTVARLSPVTRLAVASCAVVADCVFGGEFAARPTANAATAPARNAARTTTVFRNERRPTPGPLRL